jgi:hypothetical protein
MRSAVARVGTACTVAAMRVERTLFLFAPLLGGLLGQLSGGLSQVVLMLPHQLNSLVVGDERDNAV